MDLIDISAQQRATKGNGPARVLRRNEQVPAVLYGPNTASMPLTLSRDDLEKALKINKGAELLLNLKVENDEKPVRMVMLKDMQTHPLSRRILHADLYEIKMDQYIKVAVPVVVTGKSVGVEMGGVLQIVRRELEALCLPSNIPDEIILDITDMEMGDSVHIEDIEREGIEFPHDVNFTVLTLLAPKLEEEEEDEEGEEGEGLDEESEEEEADE